MNHLEEAEKVTGAIAETIEELGINTPPRAIADMSNLAIAHALIALAESHKLNVKATIRKANKINRTLNKIAEELKKANELHTYFEEAMNIDNNEIAKQLFAEYAKPNMDFIEIVNIKKDFDKWLDNKEDKDVDE